MHTCSRGTPDRQAPVRSARWVRTRIAVVALVSLAAVSCSGSGSGSASVEPTDQAAASAPVAADEPSDTEVEPTTVAVEPSPIPTASQLVESSAFENLRPLGVSPDAGFAYAGEGTSAQLSFWYDTSCDEPVQALVGIDVAASLAGGVPMTFDAGLVQSGSIEQVVFSPGGRAAVVSSCGSRPDGKAVWLQVAEFDDDGRISTLGERIPLEYDTTRGPAQVTRWVGDDELWTQLVVQPDPDDLDDFVIESRRISVDTGETLELVEAAAGESSPQRVSYASPDGAFTFTGIADPVGSLDCQGIASTTIEVDDGSGPRPALGIDGAPIKSLFDVQFGPDGLVLWMGCRESAYVGRMAPDGTILDAHHVDTDAIGFDGYFGPESDAVVVIGSTPDPEYSGPRFYRLEAGGSLIILEDLFEYGTRLFGYDLSTDPHFVTSSGIELGIDGDAPLAPTLAGTGSWFVGDTLSTEPACGGRTLYGETSTGFARAFTSGFELDTVVDIDVGPTRSVPQPVGDSDTRRAIVVSTECPDEYEGRRIWFGEESTRIRNPLYLWSGDHPEVAEVLSVRDTDNQSFEIEEMYAEVRLLDGTLTEIRLVIPREGRLVIGRPL